MFNAVLPLFRFGLDEGEDPTEFNEKKKTLLDPEIHESFLHPKTFKIGKIQLKSEPKVKTTSQKRKNEAVTNNPKKHKFQFS